MPTQLRAPSSSSVSMSGDSCLAGLVVPLPRYVESAAADIATTLRRCVVGIYRYRRYDEVRRANLVVDRARANFGLVDVLIGALSGRCKNPSLDCRAGEMAKCQ
jgi:hypothetical protein